MKENISQKGISRSKRIAITANMAALALIGNYALVFLPNIEVGTSIIFITAYVFGLQMSVACVMIMSIIFSMVNPWGGFIPHIWISQVAGWLFVAVVGSLMQNSDTLEIDEPKSILGLGLAGGLLTLFFDLSTNLGYAVAFEIPYIIALASGFWWMILHISTNSYIFSQVVPTLNSILKNQFKYEIWTSSEIESSEE